MFLSILLAIIYSGVWYISKAQGGEAWDWMKFVRTLVIGVGVGFYMVFVAHQPVTLASISQQMLLINASIIVIVDKLVTIIWNILKNIAWIKKLFNL